MVRDEWSSCGTTRDGLQNRCLNLHVACIVENAAHGTDHAITLAENFLYLWVYDEVHIALAVANFRIG